MSGLPDSEREKREQTRAEHIAKDKKISLFNNGRRTFQTSQGKWEPQSSMEFPEIEAKELLDYHDVSTTDKRVPDVYKKLDDLTAKNEALQKELDALRPKTSDKDKDKGKG